MDASLPRRRSSARRGLQRPQSCPNFHRAAPLQRTGRSGNSRVPARAPEQSFPALPRERVGRSESLGCETYSVYRLSSSRTPSFLFWQGLDIEIKGKLIGCGLILIASTSFLRLYSSQVSITSLVKTSPLSRKSWSFSTEVGIRRIAHGYSTSFWPDGWSWKSG